jgi:hypothetical protein
MVQLAARALMQAARRVLVLKLYLVVAHHKSVALPCCPLRVSYFNI